MHLQGGLIKMINNPAQFELYHKYLEYIKLDEYIQKTLNVQRYISIADVNVVDIDTMVINVLIKRNTEPYPIYVNKKQWNDFIATL